MTLPSYVHFTGPLLQYLGELRDPVRPRVVYDELAQRLRLSEEDRTARLPSGGQSVLQNRIGWAQDALKRAGLSSAPVRGTWLITEAGRKLLEKHGGRVPEEEMARIGSVSREYPSGRPRRCGDARGEVVRLPQGERRWRVRRSSGQSEWSGWSAAG
jgi:restriction system protein